MPLMRRPANAVLIVDMRPFRLLLLGKNAESWRRGSGLVMKSLNHRRDFLASCAGAKTVGGQ